MPCQRATSLSDAGQLTELQTQQNRAGLIALVDVLSGGRAGIHPADARAGSTVYPCARIPVRLSPSRPYRFDLSHATYNWICRTGDELVRAYLSLMRHPSRISVRASAPDYPRE